MVFNNNGISLDNKFRLKLVTNNGNDVLGEIYEDNEGMLNFKGNMKESAEHFLDYICRVQNTEVQKLRDVITALEKENSEFRKLM